MALGTMSEHRAMWKAQREAQGQPSSDEDWTEWLLARWREAEAVIGAAAHLNQARKKAK